MSLLKTSFRRIVSILIIICLISSIFCGSVSAQAHVFYDTKADFEFSEEGRNYYGVTHIRYLKDDPHYIVSIVTNTYISPPKQGHYSTNDVVSAVLKDLKRVIGDHSNSISTTTNYVTFPRMRWCYDY